MKSKRHVPKEHRKEIRDFVPNRVFNKDLVRARMIKNYPTHQGETYSFSCDSESVNWFQELSSEIEHFNNFRIFNDKVKCKDYIDQFMENNFINFDILLSNYLKSKFAGILYV